MKKNKTAGKTALTDLTDKQDAALRQIQRETKGEDRNTNGLEYIGRLLDGARASAEKAASKVLPDVADQRINPVPAAHNLAAVAPRANNCTLRELGELIAEQLKKEIKIKQDVLLIHNGQNRRLEEFASDWYDFLYGDLYGGLHRFMTAKQNKAQALKKLNAEKQFAEAFHQLPGVALAGTEKDWSSAERKFADTITPECFRRAFIAALEIDAAATEEINGYDAAEVAPKRKRSKHIAYNIAIAILERLNCPISRKTLQRWMNGENTPEGFTPETMKTVSYFSQWAKIYANLEQAKININNALRIDNPNSRRMQQFR